MTHRGENALVRKENDGMTVITVNGKPVLKCFNDAHYPGDAHILMAGPGGRMYTGRELPQDYLEEANALVERAKISISGQGQVSRQMRR